MDLPEELNYNSVKPIGYPAVQKEVKFYPSTYENTGTNDLVRFNISTNGFWDPYSTYILVEVDYSNTQGVLQLDSSSHSLISQLIISCKGVEIERKEEYDTISCFLNDMKIGKCAPLGTHHTGIQIVQPINQYDLAMDTGTHTSGTEIREGYKPWIEQSYYNYQSQIGSANWANIFNGSVYDTTINQISDRERYDNWLNVLETPDVVATDSPYMDITGNSSMSPVSALEGGLMRAYSPELSSTEKEMILSRTTIPGIIKGEHWKYSSPTCWQTKIPVNSCFFGHLVPKQSYKFIPMSGLQNMEWQIRFNPYAFFTSGYQNPNGWTSDETTMFTRTWSIKSVCIVTELVIFDYNTERMINDEMNTEKGIILHSSDWMLGPMYPISNGETPSGTYQINMGFESLKNIIILFIPTGYEYYSFLRKQFRLSHCMTSMQFKLGIDFFPEQAILGEAGTPTGYPVNTTDGDNLPFVEHLYEAFEKVKDIYPGCNINPFNFAINSRVYNADNTAAFVFDLTNNAEITNIDTALGLPIFHESRAVGKALFAMNFENIDNGDDNVISGINTINTKPFEVNLKSDTTAPWGATSTIGESSTMYIFANYDVMLQIKSTGIQIIGKG